MKIGIIGTAGRKPTGHLCTKALYYSMYRKAEELLSDIPIAERDLVSGGAAFADHIAVSLYRSVAAHLLTKEPVVVASRISILVPVEASLVEVTRHIEGQRVGRNTIQSLHSGSEQGATFIQSLDGFKARNLQVGKVDWLIAFTFGESSVPADGGTLHTWNHSTASKKTHISLGEL